MINIILADDHLMVRKGIKALLSSESDFRIVGEAEEGLETLELVEKLQPEILVLDLMMTGINGLEVTRQLNFKGFKTNIVILSMHNNETYVQETLRFGAKAYILKDSSPEELVHAIREVLSGRRYLSPSLTERAIEAYTQKYEAYTNNPFNQLTTREREILQFSAQGYSNNDIASRLFISPRTVDTHRTNLMRKLELHNHTQLIRFAIQQGIIPGQL
jgi:two-component system, NarL family, response regulator NreC